MSRKAVGSMSQWSGMLKDFFRQIDDGSITMQQLQAFLEHRNPFEAVDPTIITDWQNFYREVFGIDVDFSKLRIPDKKAGFDRLIIVARGMTPQRLYDKCTELFLCWKWTLNNLDEIVNSERTSEDGAYAVWVRDAIEASEELRGLSAADLKKQGIPGITLEERLLYELKYFKEKNKHLDVKHISLCSGSRYSDGFVPGVFWQLGQLWVDRFSPHACSWNLRSRRVVL